MLKNSLNKFVVKMKGGFILNWAYKSSFIVIDELNSLNKLWNSIIYQVLIAFRFRGLMGAQKVNDLKDLSSG